MNVAFQTNQLGFQSVMISRVGMDSLGDALLDFLEEKGVSTQMVQKDPIHPTGVVHVSLDDKGIPSYEIAQPAAWDFITLDEAMLHTVRQAKALVFGSLSCRSELSRNTLLQLLEVAPFRVFDVNLRAPFYEQALLETLLSRADLVKVNDQELHILSGWYHLHGSEPEQMEGLRQKFGFDTLVVTRGEHGAACMSPFGYTETPGKAVQVQDTIGSGDAFLSGFLSRRFNGGEDLDCLQFANAMGAITATKSGGTPSITQLEIQAFLAGF